MVAKNGMDEWNTLNEEQRGFVHVFFMGCCSKHTGIGCMNMSCRNSPLDILKCPKFKQWRREWMLEQVKVKAVAEKQEEIRKDYIDEVWERLGEMKNGTI